MPLSIKHFGFEAGEDAEVLRVALEAAERFRDLVERPLTVVSVRRMPDVVGQAGEVHQVRVATQADGHPAADLRDLQRVGQPGPRGLALAGADHLRLVGEAAKRRAVQHPRPVPGESRAVLVVGAGQRGSLRRFVHRPSGVELVVAVALSWAHRGTVCQHAG
jgi:hypothetical protein